MINLNIKNLLELIKREASTFAGNYERRLPTESSLPVYLGVEIPSNLYNFSIIFNGNFSELLSDDGTEGFSIKISEHSKSSELFKFNISLLNVKYSEIFLILCSDLLNVLETNEELERATLINLNKRLDYWRQFLKRSRIDKLTPEAEVGLMGELLALKKMVEVNPNLDLITHWRGPMGSTHDFIFEDLALEVKTSTAKQKRFVKISSEYQLDKEGGCSELFLCHIEIMEVQKSTQSFNLPTLITGIKNLININSQLIFEGLLACAGYRDSDSHFYDKRNFSLLEVSSYMVTEDFPKIINKSLSPNISNVKYKLNLSGLDKFKFDADILFEKLRDK